MSSIWSHRRCLQSTQSGCLVSLCCRRVHFYTEILIFFFYYFTIVGSLFYSLDFLKPSLPHCSLRWCRVKPPDLCYYHRNRKQVSRYSHIVIAIAYNYKVSKPQGAARRPWHICRAGNSKLNIFPNCNCIVQFTEDIIIFMLIKMLWRVS